MPESVAFPRINNRVAKLFQSEPPAISAVGSISGRWGAGATEFGATTGAARATGSAATMTADGIAAAGRSMTRGVVGTAANGAAGGGTSTLRTTAADTPAPPGGTLTVEAGTGWLEDRAPGIVSVGGEIPMGSKCCLKVTVPVG